MKRRPQSAKITQSTRSTKRSSRQQAQVVNGTSVFALVDYGRLSTSPPAYTYQTASPTPNALKAEAASTTRK